MPGLMDVAPARATVEVNGTPIEVRGVSVGDIIVLFGRFPELRDMLLQQAPSVDALVAMAPKAISAIIAAGTGQLGDEAIEKTVDSLGASMQIKLLSEVVRLTMPEGFGPFVESLTSLAGTFNQGTASMHPATTSQLQ